MPKEEEDFYAFDLYTSPDQTTLVEQLLTICDKRLNPYNSPYDLKVIRIPNLGKFTYKADYQNSKNQQADDLIFDFNNKI
jgi:hypothetical protein